MKNLNSRVDLRVQAIDIVNSHRVILSDNLYVDAMKNASHMYPDKEGVDLFSAIFGKENAEHIKKEMNNYTTLKNVMSDNSVSLSLRSFFCDNLLKAGGDWEAFKNGFSK